MFFSSGYAVSASFTVFSISFRPSLVFASKRSIIAGSVFDALTSPHPSGNCMRAPSTVTTSYFSFWNLSVISFTIWNFLVFRRLYAYLRRWSGILGVLR